MYKKKNQNKILHISTRTTLTNVVQNQFNLACGLAHSLQKRDTTSMTVHLYIALLEVVVQHTFNLCRVTNAKILINCLILQISNVQLKWLLYFALLP